MIALTTGQPVAGDNDYVVVAGGNYAPDELVDCHPIGRPEQTVAFLAQFCADGTYPS